jgi:hypothetical protein
MHSSVGHSSSSGLLVGLLTPYFLEAYRPVRQVWGAGWKEPKNLISCNKKQQCWA